MRRHRHEISERTNRPCRDTRQAHTFRTIRIHCRCWVPINFHMQLDHLSYENRTFRLEFSASIDIYRRWVYMRMRFKHIKRAPNGQNSPDLFLDLASIHSFEIVNCVIRIYFPSISRRDAHVCVYAIYATHRSSMRGLLP